MIMSKRILSAFLVLLLVVMLVFCAYQRNAKAITGIDDIILWVVYTVLLNLGVNMALGDITIDNLRASMENIMGAFRDFVSLTPAYWIFEAASWSGLIDDLQNIDITDILSFDLNYTMVSAIGTAWNDYVDSMSGDINVDVILSSNYTTNNGYYLNEAYLILTKTHQFVNVDAYDVNGVIDTRTFNMRYDRYFIEMPTNISENSILIVNRMIAVDNCYPYFSSEMQANFPHGGYVCELVEKNSVAYEYMLDLMHVTSSGMIGSLILSDKNADLYGGSYGSFGVFYVNGVKTVLWYNQVNELFPIFNYETNNVVVPAVLGPSNPYVYQTGSYSSLLNGVSILHMQHDNYIYDTKKLAMETKESRLDSVMQGWSIAISSGEIDVDDTMTVAVPQNIDDVVDMMEYGFSVSGSGVNAADITDAITDAYAEINAQAAEADIPLHQLTLPQAIATRFPFCIPFDLYNAFAGLNAPRVAPSWELPWTVNGVTVNVVADLSYFEEWAKIIRYGVLVSFVIGLIIVTRKLIKG